MSECELFWVGGTLFWVGGGEWGCMVHYFGWVGVRGKIFWLSGGEWGWVHCLIIPHSDLRNTI